MHKDFKQSILHSFVDHQIQAKDHLKAEVFTNQSYDDQLLSGIIDRLKNVKSFDIAVAL